MGLVRLNPDIQPPSIEQPISSNEIAAAKKDAFINRTAVSPQTYPEIYGTLLAYPDGAKVVVEYFRQRTAYINNQTLDTGLSLERGAVHSSYDLVHNLAMHIKDQLNIEIDPNTNETTITGEGVLFPGFKPNPGDSFYLRLPDDTMGVFTVDLVTPLSIHKGAHTAISFHLYEYLTADIDTKLRSSIAEELWFETQTFFNGEVTLLSDISYKQLQKLDASRRNIINYLTTQFYDRAERTLISTDGIFDTYLVEFINNKISTKDTRLDICQLSLTFIDDFEYTIFGVMLSRDVSQLVYTGYTLANYNSFLWDTNISTIGDYRIVRVISTEPIEDTNRSAAVKFDINDAAPKVVSYHFSDRFYYALIHSFESGSLIADIVPLLADMANDARIHPNLSNSFYSINSNQYHEIGYFDVHNIATGSNNNIHIPELEFVVVDYLLNGKLDIPYLVDTVLVKFPFVGMSNRDLLYYLPIILHLIDVAIPRLR